MLKICSKSMSLEGSYQRVWHSRFCHIDTFVSISCDWDVVRYSRLLWEIDMIPSNYANTYNGCWWPIEIFFADSKVSHHIHKISLFLTILGDFSENPLKTSKKHEKLLSAHVCKHIMRLRRHTMLPFALADRYDPKQLYKHTQWVLVTYRKIFRGLQSQSSCSQNLIFWWFLMIFCAKSLEN